MQDDEQRTDKRGTTHSTFTWFGNSDKEKESNGEKPVSNSLGEVGKSLVFPEGTFGEEREPVSLCFKGDLGRDWDFAGPVANGRIASCRHRLQTQPENEESDGRGKKGEALFLFPETGPLCDPFKGAYKFQMGYTQGMSATSEARTGRSRDYLTGFVVGGLVTLGVIYCTFQVIPCN
jgi:hypothetical protein